MVDFHALSSPNIHKGRQVSPRVAPTTGTFTTTFANFFRGRGGGIRVSRCVATHPVTYERIDLLVSLIDRQQPRARSSTASAEARQKRKRVTFSNFNTAADAAGVHVV